MSSPLGYVCRFRLMSPLRWLVACLWLFVSVQPGNGIDAVDFHTIGFSKNARWFAFTEFVVLDGSGVPYVRTYVLDIETNRWEAGTPISVEQEGITLFAAHDMAKKLAAPKLQGLGIRYPGRTLVVNPLAEITNNTAEVVFKPHRTAPEITLTAGSFAATTTVDCQHGMPVGLFLTGKVEGKAPVELYRDKFKQLPKLRRCATNYSIAAVYGVPDPTSLRAVVLLYVGSPGWEGEDSYLTAVSITLPGPG